VITIILLRITVVGDFILLVIVYGYVYLVRYTAVWLVYCIWLVGLWLVDTLHVGLPDPLYLLPIVRCYYVGC